MKAQNQSWVAQAQANGHSEGIAYKPRDGEIGIVPASGADGAD